MKKRKIISSFMYSEPYEKDLLIAKIKTESLYVDEWHIVESKETFHKENKELTLNKVLKNKEFNEYKSRIFTYFIDKFPEKIISKSNLIISNLKSISNKIKKRGYIEYEKNNFDCEAYQRSYGMKKNPRLGKEDLIINCDLDEILCIKKENIRNFKNNIDKNQACIKYIPRISFIYDIDNLRPSIRYTPVCNGQYLINTNFNMQAQRNKIKINNKNLVSPQISKILEYSFCFKKKFIYNKLNSFAHYGLRINQENIDCLKLNIPAVRSMAEFNRKVKNPEFWLEKYINYKNLLPIYMLENESKYKTNLINENYQIYRIQILNGIRDRIL